MNRAIAAFCCAVVGLEILIGVPVAVCTGFLLMSQEVGTAVAVGPTTYSVGPTYSAPYDPYAPSLPVPPLPPPSMSLAPPLPPGCQPQTCPTPNTMASAPPVPSEIAPKIAEPPPTPARDAVLESSAEIGSPLAGTLLDAPGSSAERAAAFEKAAAEDEAELERPMLTLEPNEQTGQETRPTGEPTSEPAALDALAAAAEHLYQLAARYEADYSYSRADAVRELARNLRAELGIVRNEASHESPHDFSQPAPQLSDQPRLSSPSVPSDLPAAPPGNPSPNPLPAENPAEEARRELTSPSKLSQ